MKKKFLRTMEKAVVFIKKETWKISILMCGLMMSPTTFLANNPTNGSTGSGASAADAKWNTVVSFITPWISRLGGVVILIGAIEFGLGWKNDQPDKKTDGIRTVIAGCIVFAVGVSSDLFLA